MEVKFSNECLDVLRRLEISENLVVNSCNNRTRGMIIPGNPMQIYATTWHDDGKIIYINGTVTDSEKVQNRMEIKEVTLSVALQLQEKLPAGTISREMNMEQILDVVANSFGLMINIDSANPQAPSRLYSGPWNGNTADIKISERINNDSCLMTGVFKADGTCHHVWMFSYSKYSQWFVGE